MPAEMAQQGMAAERLLPVAEPHAGMHDEVGDAGERIVPAEVLEIEEMQAPVGGPERIVRAHVEE